MDAAAKRPLLLRLVEDYWGVFLLLVAWQLWVIANSFNPIVMPTPTAVLGDLVTHPDVYLRNVGITLAVAGVGPVGRSRPSAWSPGCWSARGWPSPRGSRPSPQDS
jgi:hypothetical protein